MEFVRKSFAIFTIALLCVGSANAMQQNQQPVINNVQPNAQQPQINQPVINPVQPPVVTTPGFLSGLWIRVYGWGASIGNGVSSVYSTVTDAGKSALTTSVADATYSATLSLLTSGGSAYATRNAKIGLPLVILGILGRGAFNRYCYGSTFNRHTFFRSCGEGLCGAGLATLGGHNNNFRKLLGLGAFALGGILLSNTLKQVEPVDVQQPNVVQP